MYFILWLLLRFTLSLIFRCLTAEACFFPELFGFVNSCASFTKVWKFSVNVSVHIFTFLLCFSSLIGTAFTIIWELWLCCTGLWDSSHFLPQSLFSSFFLRINYLSWFIFDLIDSFSVICCLAHLVKILFLKIPFSYRFCIWFFFVLLCFDFCSFHSLWDCFKKPWLNIDIMVDLKSLSADYSIRVILLLVSIDCVLSWVWTMFS